MIEILDRILSSPACGSIAVILFVVLFVAVIEAIHKRNRKKQGCELEKPRFPTSTLHQTVLIPSYSA